MASIHYISSEYLSLSKLNELIHYDFELALSEDAILNIKKCREYLDEKIKNQSEPIYGINTGFGSLCDEKISSSELEQLQVNLVKSHACGMGDEVPSHIVKCMLLLKIQSLSYGHSGVQLETVNRLIDFYNNDIFPVVYQQGSLGASGDLAPLAHLSLPLLGLGEVYFKQEKHKASYVLEKFDWSPIQLKSKEGLALLNGTQFMCAYALSSLFDAYKYFYLSNLCGAISLDAFNGRIEAFDNLVHAIRPHEGQLLVAQQFREFLQDSEQLSQKKHSVQDPYSFRCIPQVHGASYDAINHACKVILTEVNSVSDNPNVFVEEDKIISAGNFHGQPLALVLDFLAIAVSELASISERRTYLLISGQRDLPPYLISKQGLNSGFMIAQYTAASIVSQNKQLCTPASVDSIVSSNGQEDHVSMGANSATKLFRVVENVKRVISIEMMCASQDMYFRTSKSSDFIEKFLESYRMEITPISEDVVLHNKMMDSLFYLENLVVDDELLF
jgi:histidine ammonia-lyase